MAFNKDNELLAQEWNALKARVKAEMLRRNQVGSLTNFGSAAYDYTDAPSENGIIQIEHINKIIEPLAQINASALGVTTKNINDPVTHEDLGAVSAFLSVAEGYGVTGSKTDCAASCSGLCVGSCNATCANDCTGSCSNTCTGSCTGSCSGTCSGTCSGGCSGGCLGCSGGCTGGCSDGCTGACSGYCYTSCSGTCRTGTNSKPSCTGFCSLVCGGSCSRGVQW